MSKRCGISEALSTNGPERSLTGDGQPWPKALFGLRSLIYEAEKNEHFDAVIASVIRI